MAHPDTRSSTPAPADPGDGPGWNDPRPRWRRLLGPIATLFAVLGATAYVRAVDPNVPGHYPGCPTQLLWGIDCPGCGGLRATHALAQGDLGAAADHNLLVVIALPFVVIGLLVWVHRAWRGRIPDPSRFPPLRATVHRILPMAVLAFALLFAVVRNLTPYLGSGIG